MFGIPIDLHLSFQLARPHSPDDDAPLAGRPQAPLRPPRGRPHFTICQESKSKCAWQLGPPLSLTLAKDVTERESAHHHENDGKGQVAVYKSKTSRRGRSQAQQRQFRSRTHTNPNSAIVVAPTRRDDGPGLDLTHPGRRAGT